MPVPVCGPAAHWRLHALPSFCTTIPLVRILVQSSSQYVANQGKDDEWRSTNEGNRFQISQIQKRICSTNDEVFPKGLEVPQTDSRQLYDEK